MRVNIHTQRGGVSPSGALLKREKIASRGQTAHVPVLLRETLDALDPGPGETFADGTLGAGGHAREILKRIGRSGKLLVVDWDRDAVNRFAATREGKSGNVKAVEGNFAELPRILYEAHIGLLDGLLLDLGFSSDQLGSGRGFSFSTDEPLAMTYGRDEAPLSDELARMSEQEMCDAIRVSGERYARQIARAIFRAERKRKIRTTGEFAAIIRGALPRSYERGRIDPATRTFLALRIHVNREIENLQRLLGALPDMMREGGRIAIITFQSIEDKLVKDAFRALAREGRAELVTKKPIVPSRDESRANPRSRSAKLRVARMLGASVAANLRIRSSAAASSRHNTSP
ncbi:MAG: 16S rRNA (cytosine(1402)-N(4))-methyltransferase RsmH [Candidatus Colwellbacteria bacterium]|nr:16S rRNA (cytosine(1402)-N(4))-methyltransferase RsmH [Candidatus Colwellbacteria bacterium]